MDADIDPRIGHQRGDKIKRKSESLQSPGKKIHGRKDINRMGRGERVGSIAVCEHETNLFENMAGSNSSHPIFKEMTGKLVGNGYRKAQKYQGQDSPLLLSPENPDGQQGEHINKILEVRHEGHKPIEKIVLPLLIDENEKSHIPGR